MSNYTKKHWKVSFIIVILSILISTIPIMNIRIKQEVIDSILIDKGKLIENMILFTGLIIAFYVIQIINTLVKENYLSKIRSDLSTDVLNGIIKYSAIDVGINNDIEVDIDTIISQYIELIVNNYFNGRIDLFVTIVISLFSYIYAFYVNWIIGIYSTAFMIICYFVNVHGGNLISETTTENGEISSKFIKQTNNILRNFRVIKNFKAEYGVIKEFKLLNNTYTESYLKLKKRMVKFNTINAIIYALQKIGIIIIGGFIYYFKLISPGELVSVIFLSSLLSSPIINISNGIMKIKSTDGIRKEINSFLTKDNREGAKADNEERLFIYESALKADDKVLIKDINFEITKKKKYLIIGKNGTGKSTLLKLVLKNVIMKNNDDYKCGIVFQNDTVLDTSISNNITLFGDSDEKQMQQVLSSIDLNKDINSIINKGENNISGGEKQKILLARALVSNSNFLLLDEPFSAIDSKTSVKLMDTLLDSNKTILMISHHINKELLLKFDTVILLDNQHLHFANEKLEKEKLYEQYIKAE